MLILDCVLYICCDLESIIIWDLIYVVFGIYAVIWGLL